MHIYSYNLNMSATDTWASSIYIPTAFYVSIFGLVTCKNPLLPIFYLENTKCEVQRFQICYYCMCEMGRQWSLSHVNYDCRLNEHWVQP